ncbi:hypothetical protein [Pararhizobium sp.]|uniref:hypothetical protein n=1 Tax=Pararhizobium sp. TaxID=1977563 RepID=UPI003D133CB0
MIEVEYEIAEYWEGVVEVDSVIWCNAEWTIVACAEHCRKVNPDMMTEHFSHSDDFVTLPVQYHIQFRKKGREVWSHGCIEITWKPSFSGLYHPVGLSHDLGKR